jgi:hypothetical protein
MICREGDRFESGILHKAAFAAFFYGLFYEKEMNSESAKIKTSESSKNKNF